MAGFAMAGNYVGTVVGMPVSGLLASYVGWQSVFYFFGAIGVLWLILWMIFVRASPSNDKFISKEEREYIEASLRDCKDSNDKVSNIPWRGILTSKPFWAIVVAHFCESWGFFTLFTELPSFLKGMCLAFMNFINHFKPFTLYRHVELQFG
jgi:MFS transporter, ACS family, solute carrier family 17 (sodium-dependent inorganic phosphate cotransporter), other